MHFQHGKYNTGIERFHTMAQRFPKVRFIGHAQTWGGKRPESPADVMYPKGKVTPAAYRPAVIGLPQRVWRSPAGSINAPLRDEDHARTFWRVTRTSRFTSDCSDHDGAGGTCSGSQQLAAVKRLASDAQAVRKMLYVNATRVMKIA
jgi:hypothetical protein